VTEEYVDHGVSGAKASRPALDRLMADARKGKLDVVAVWRFDRFARSTKHLLDALEEFRAVGIDFVSQQEAIDTSTPMGRMVFTMVGAVADYAEPGLMRRGASRMTEGTASGPAPLRIITPPGERRSARPAP